MLFNYVLADNRLDVSTRLALISQLRRGLDGILLSNYTFWTDLSWSFVFQQIRLRFLFSD